MVHFWWKAMIGCISEGKNINIRAKKIIGVLFFPKNTTYYEYKKVYILFSVLKFNNSLK